MTRSNREIERLLQGKFKFRYTNKSHRWLELQLPNRCPVRTFVSHGRDTVGGDLEKKMATQLEVTVQYFRGMMGCTNSYESYYQTLTETLLDN